MMSFERNTYLHEAGAERVPLLSVVFEYCMDNFVTLHC